MPESALQPQQLAQAADRAAAPTPAPTQGTTEQAPPPVSQAPMGDLVIYGLLGLFIALLLAAGLVTSRRRKARRTATELPPKAERLELPRKPRPAPEALPSERERAEAEARRKAEYDQKKAAEREQRARRLEEIAALPPEERAAQERLLAEEARKAREEEEAERRRRKAEEEQRKKAEFLARKEAERAEKERRAKEKAEAEVARLQAIEDARAREEAERLAAEEARRRKIEAEAGKTLIEGLSRTREGGFVARLSGLFGGQAEVSEQTIGELEEILFTADIGVKTSMRLVEGAQQRLARKELGSPGKLKKAIRADVSEILLEASRNALPAEKDLGLPLGDKRPHVIMVVGVNGAGKTTTIGKLAAKLKARGQTVLLAAGDTFRAAATEQLDVWAQRADVPMVRGAEDSDPGAVIFEAVQRAVNEDIDVVIADTAGRLHTRAPLMEELKKVKRVIDKARPGAPDEILLVLDATMGQNAIQQARQFHDALGVTGIVLTKLDGTAKGGVVIGISDELKIPVRLIGIGESLADLRPFNPNEFVDALFGT